MFERNIGNTDRNIRTALGIIAAVFAIYYNSWILGIVAAILLITAFTRFCGLYRLFGISTSKAKAEK